MRARRGRPIAIAAILVLNAGCGGSSPSAPDDVRVGLTPIAASAEWPVSSPAAERIDTARVEDLTLRIRQGQWARISSLLVARNGRLVVEEYFDGMSGDRVHTQQSVTKSVTALLAAMAVQSGRMRFDDRVLSLFPHYEPVAKDRKSTRL